MTLSVGTVTNILHYRYMRKSVAWLRFDALGNNLPISMKLYLHGKGIWENIGYVSCQKNADLKAWVEARKTYRLYNSMKPKKHFAMALNLDWHYR